MLLKKDLVYRAFMIYKNEKSLCLSSKVHDALNAADKDSIVEVLIELIGQGELVTLRQLSYYTEKLGLRLDLASNYIEYAPYLDSEDYIDITTGEFIYMYDCGLNRARVSYTPYLIAQTSGWLDERTISVRVVPLRDFLLLIRLEDLQSNEVVEVDERFIDPFEDAVFECDVYAGDVEF